MTFSDKYEEDGYIFPLTAMTETDALHYRDSIEQFETVHGEMSKTVRGYGSIAIDFIDRISRLTSILDAVSEILGPDLLVWGSSLFIKEPFTTNFVSWHQDLTYWGLSDNQEVTAWIALTKSTIRNGCMRFIPRSHRTTAVEHRDTFSPLNMLSRGQELTVEVDETNAVDVVLEAGEFSLHHGHIFHASNPNRSNDRRIGLAIRYITPKMAPVGNTQHMVQLVRGLDHYHHFELAPKPSGVMEPSDAERMLRAEQLQAVYAYDGAAQAGKRRQ